MSNYSNQTQVPTENLSQVLSYKSATGMLSAALVNDKDELRGKCGMRNLGSNLGNDFTIRVSEDENIFEALEGLDLSSSLMDSIKGAIGQ